MTTMDTTFCYYIYFDYRDVNLLDKTHSKNEVKMNNVPGTDFKINASRTSGKKKKIHSLKNNNYGVKIKILRQ